MKKRKILIILLILFSTLLIALSIINFIYSKKDAKDILKNNGYQLVDTYLKGEKIEEITFTHTTYKFNKNQVYVFVYLYDDYSEIEKEIAESIKVNRSLNLKPEVTKKEQYLMTKVCEEEFCDYMLGYQKYLLMASSNSEETSTEIEKIFKKITSK